MIPYCLFIVGFSFIAYGIITGEVTVGFIVFVPFMSSTGIFGFLGFSFLFLGMISLFLLLSMYYSHQEYQNNVFLDTKVKSGIIKSRKKIKSAGIVFIGPIPIIFGFKLRNVGFMILLCIIVLVLLFIYASLLLNR